MNASPKPGRRGPRLLLALFLGAAAAAGVYLYVGSVQQSAQQSARVAAQQATAAVSSRAKVVVAKATLPAQTALSADNVEVREVSTDSLQPNAAVTVADVQGKAVSVPV